MGRAGGREGGRAHRQFEFRVERQPRLQTLRLLRQRVLAVALFHHCNLLARLPRQYQALGTGGQDVMHVVVQSFLSLLKRFKSVTDRPLEFLCIDVPMLFYPIQILSRIDTLLWMIKSARPEPHCMILSL